MQRANEIVASVLPALLQKAPLTPEKVQFAWRAAVGPQIARATRVELRAGRVIVRADDSRWTDEIRRAAHLIVPKLRALLGEDHVSGLTVAER
ncbi:MAG TPA: DciA family protein [Vicinamibacterales bacterium]|nr:DciA family protein [Vicinamibacterales bacterium]